LIRKNPWKGYPVLAPVANMPPQLTRLMVVTAVLVTPLLVARLTNRATVLTVGMIWIWGGFFERGVTWGDARLRMERFPLRRAGIYESVGVVEFNAWTIRVTSGRFYGVCFVFVL
jgi:hypothetical protein